MKICHIITRLIVGGAQENTFLTCDGQQKAGHEVLLLSGPSLGPEGSLVSQSGDWRIPCLEIPHLRRSVDPLRDFLALFEIWFFLLREKPDVFHTHSAKAGILGRMAAGLVPGRRPVVVHTIHGLPFHPYQSRLLNTFYILLERAASFFTDAFISVADTMTTNSLRAGIGRPGIYRTVFSAFEVEEFSRVGEKEKNDFRKRFGLAADDFVIGKVARLFDLKGHDQLLPVFARLRSACPGLKLLLVGDGDLRARLEKMAVDLGIEKDVIFTGLLAPSEIPDALAAMDILVHVSLREGLPRAVSQALAASVPVVAYDTDGTREVVHDRVTGFLVPRGNIKKLEADLFEAVRDYQGAEEMARAGQEFILENFNVPVMVARIEDVYREAFSRRLKRRRG